jgi:predicted dehydrogenase
MRKAPPARGAFLCVGNLVNGPVLFDLAKNDQICFSAAVREFVEGIRNGRPFPTDRLDILETLRLMEASYVAAGVKF